MAKKLLDGKVVIVTGAGSGIGQSIADLFASEGASVVVNDISEVTATATVESIRRNTGRDTSATAFPCDVSDRSAVQRMVDFAVDTYGRLDIAVSNAYFSGRSDFLEQDFKEVQKTFEVTSYGAYHLCQLSARRMKEWTTAASPGRLIIIGSVMADYPYLIETSTAYNMAKASTDALTKTIASSLARHYITVNSIHPGWIDTQVCNTMRHRVATVYKTPVHLGVTQQIIQHHSTDIVS
eukprot:m.555578 g.555578  ORF g.555578 m.555578 type:complete len:238 (+) comp22183_c0_seq7:253-966(+)